MKKYQALTIPLVLVAGAIFTQGCCTCSTCGERQFIWDDHCADIPKGAIPAEVGSFSCAWQSAHVQAAEKKQLTVYQSDWVGDTAQLSELGSRQVRRMSQLLMTHPHEILVEPNGRADIDQKRRETLVKEFTQLGVELPDESIVFAAPNYRGLHGVESRAIKNSILARETRAGQSVLNQIGLSSR